MALLAVCGYAGASTPDKRIHYFKGICVIKLGMTRAKVDKLLGKPQQAFPLEAGISGANYTDEKLSIYYRRKSKKVVSVQTFSPTYSGTPAVGKAFATKRRCTPIDRHSAPGGGPRRVGACLHDSSGPGMAIITLGVADSRAAQRVTNVAILRRAARGRDLQRPHGRSPRGTRLQQLRVQVAG